MCGKALILSDSGELTEIFPGAESPTVYGKNDRILRGNFLWGYPKQNRNGVIFNARAESVLQKTLFREDFLNRRLALPVVGFSEWTERLSDGKKREYRFENSEPDPIFLAGFFKVFPDRERFVLLTTDATFSKEIHPRFPLILTWKDVDDYLFDRSFAEYFLRTRPISLNSFAL